MANDASASNAEIESTLASLYDNVGSMVNYTTVGEANTAAALKYRMSVALEVALDTNWQLLDTLKLRNVTFRAAVSKTHQESRQSYDLYAMHCSNARMYHQ